jgi:hypothetical protein
VIIPGRLWQVQLILAGASGLLTTGISLVTRPYLDSGDDMGDNVSRLSNLVMLCFLALNHTHGISSQVRHAREDKVAMG